MHHNLAFEVGRIKYSSSDRTTTYLVVCSIKLLALSAEVSGVCLGSTEY